MPLRMRDTNRDETVVQVDEFDIFWDDGEFILSRGRSHSTLADDRERWPHFHSEQGFFRDSPPLDARSAEWSAVDESDPHRQGDGRRAASDDDQVVAPRRSFLHGVGPAAPVPIVK